MCVLHVVWQERLLDIVYALFYMGLRVVDVPWAGVCIYVSDKRGVRVRHPAMYPSKRVYE